ncbi:MULTISPECIES: hypothetical protein [Pandoraea]|uniref:Lipoprotein n=1 Tax=Pandoraea capi TaxID=2508286 RepID=A0ABY6W8Z1_9BURK|nr:MULTISPECIES: hypothetical protein [Pandoraea]MCI3206984.1 hypothetical protein [Pandoraea sp. LA3]MDN4585012.1 hypothetical protein [Pandoraea capi]ODP31188.1 hypothetical protein A9762_07105 [Pandoraea sp. ISTKB]VVE40781.1 hypothetical protein PCA20602_04156 [Pandoraea capi]
MKRLAMVLALAAVASVTLGGCLFATPAPVIAAQVAATMVSTGVVLSDQLPSISPPTQAAAPELLSHNMCIELPSDGISDLLPAIQGRLRAYGIVSTIYSPGTWPTGCVVLNYNVRRAWRNSLWGNAPSEYLAYATLTLSQNGSVINTVYFDGRSSTVESWSASNSRMAQLVDRLVVF